MSVNREQREIVTRAILRYLRCEIDSLQLDDILFNSDAPDDYTANYLSEAMWPFYCDMDRHFHKGKFELPAAIVESLLSWITLLDSDAEVDRATLKAQRGRLFDWTHHAGAE
ncbi:MAG: hypothetical protein JWN70_4401 [Planctomycetaceae bacterium]|nr:hypothetical protein [Planctomycetaceae bacterium]